MCSSTIGSDRGSPDLGGLSLLTHSGPALSLANQNGSHLDCCSFFTSSSVRGSGKSRLITFAFTVPSSTIEPITAQYSSGAGAREWMVCSAYWSTLRRILRCRASPARRRRTSFSSSYVPVSTCRPPARRMMFIIPDAASSSAPPHAKFTAQSCIFAACVRSSGI